jgi:uncharacterized protein GlcG (DUF336 family)
MTSGDELTHEAAQRLVAETVRHARSIGQPVCVAVVDRGGNPLATLRMDEAQLGAYDIALDKAWTAVAFDAPTEAWSEVSQPGNRAWGFNTVLGGRVVVFAGGLPIRSNGRLLGAIGVSGGPPSTDAECARAGLEGAGFDLKELEE